MKRYKQVIKGRPYWYANDLMYIAKGKSKPFRKYLGPVEQTTKEQLAIAEAAFRHAVLDREAVERAEFWHPHAGPFFTKQEILKLEQKRGELYRTLNDLGGSARSALEAAFLIDFIYNSNKIEGSRLPRERVKELFEEGTRSNNEVANTVRAKEFIDTRFAFTRASLIKAHTILLAHEPEKHGLRKGAILVGDDETLANADQIKTLLDRLFAWYHDNTNTLYPLEFAFTFYYEFERIHPFEDGNGRIGRLIMNKILKEARYHPIIIWNRQRQAHFTAFKRAANGHLPAFHQFMAEQYAKTYKTYIGRIEPAKDIQKLVDKFLSPSEME